LFRILGTVVAIVAVIAGAVTAFVVFWICYFIPSETLKRVRTTHLGKSTIADRLEAEARKLNRTVECDGNEWYVWCDIAEKTYFFTLSSRDRVVPLSESAVSLYQVGEFLPEEVDCERRLFCTSSKRPDVCDSVENLGSSEELRKCMSRRAGWTRENP
jgi:hypothetical protein